MVWWLASKQVVFQTTWCLCSLYCLSFKDVILVWQIYSKCEIKTQSLLRYWHKSLFPQTQMTHRMTRSFFSSPESTQCVRASKAVGSLKCHPRPFRAGRACFLRNHSKWGPWWPFSGLHWSFLRQEMSFLKNLLFILFIKDPSSS